MGRKKIPESVKRKSVSVALSPFEIEELKALSPRNEVSDGIRIALSEANLLQQQRKLALEVRANVRRG